VKKPGRPPVPLYLPTPEDIERETALIRAEWSEHTWKRKRRQYGASLPPPATYRMFVEEGE
jgi:hypothetical protein